MFLTFLHLWLMLVESELMVREAEKEMFPLAVFCVFVRGRDLLGTRPYFPTHCYINEARSHHSLPLKSHTAANLPPPHVSFFYFAVDSADCLVSWSRRKQQGEKSFLERKKTEVKGEGLRCRCIFSFCIKASRPNLN